MRLIDADALIERCGDWYVEEGTESGFIGTIKNLLATEPTIQPVESDTNVGDTISRQAARHALCKAVHKGEDIPCENQTASCLWTGTRVCDFVREIDALPSAQPEPKEGEWVQVSAQKYFTSASYFYRCSVCGENNPRNTKYCPNCGADMRGEKDG